MTNPEGKIPSTTPIPLARAIQESHDDLLNIADPMMLPQISRKDAMIDIVLLASVVLAVEFLASSALPLVFGVDPTGADLKRRLMFPMVILRAAASMLGISAVLWFRRQGPAAIGLRKDGLLLDLGVGVVTLAAAGTLVLSLMLLLSWLWPGYADQMRQNTEFIVKLAQGNSLLKFSAIMLTVGFYEELLFRGFLLPRLRRITGSWTSATILGSLVFAILHAREQEWAAVFTISILAFVLSIVTIVRRSIFPAVIAHALFNLIAIVQARSVGV